MYLESAPPHRGLGEDKTWEVLRHIIDDQKLMVDKIADQVEALDGTPNMGEFPMEFSGFHDLSMDFIVQQVLKRQRDEASMIEKLAEQLDAGSQARALAQESLGAAKAHIQSLEECISAAA